MAPQLMRDYVRSKKYLGVMTYGYGNVLTKRPALAALALTVIDTWSIIEMRLNGMLAHFLKADIQAAIKMLWSVESAGGRRAIILAAAEHALPPNDYRLFVATLWAMKTSEKHRQWFAHRVWAVSDQLPDELLLLSPKDFNMSAAAFKEFNLGKGPDERKLRPPDTPDSVNEFHSIQIYNERDLQDYVRQADHASQLVMKLWLLASHASDSLQGDSTRQQLLAEPAVAREFQRASTQKPR